MNILLDNTTPAKETVESIDIYSDFIAFLNRLAKEPIKRTLTGNISLKNIDSLLHKLKTTRSRINEYRKYGWNLHTEQELPSLEQIRILAETMHLTYKRKGRLFLSKTGEGFLNNLPPIRQYYQMVLHYWQRVNWDYFSVTKSIDGTSLTNILQENQNELWRTLLAKGDRWLDYRRFCLALYDYFHLEPFINDQFSEADEKLFSDISHALFDRNLFSFNCIELESKSGKYEWEKDIIRFRSTPVGLYLYQKALYENYI